MSNEAEGKGLSMTEQAFNKEEAISFGQLIAIAEAMYAPGLTNPPIPPDLSADWDVLKNINVEAAVDFIKQTEFIGFVARSKADPTHVVTVFHGTRSILDIIDDIEFQRVPFPCPMAGRQSLASPGCTNP